MSGDIFGNLREWGEVPEQLWQLSESGSVSEHEAGLVRILRYRENWRLREMVLRVLDDLESPSDRVLSAVLDILADETLYREVRVLAAEKLAHLVGKRLQEVDKQYSAEVHEVIRRVELLRQQPHEPVLDSAIDQSFEAIRASLSHARSGPHGSAVW